MREPNRLNPVEFAQLTDLADWNLYQENRFSLYAGDHAVLLEIIDVEIFRNKIKIDGNASNRLLSAHGLAQRGVQAPWRGKPLSQSKASPEQDERDKCRECSMMNHAFESNRH